MVSWRVSEPADATDVPVGASYIRENNTQIEKVCTAARLTAGTPIPDYFPVGGTTKTWFYLDVAPTGWTQLAGSMGDTLLAVKGGTTYTTGGAGAGNWTLPTHALTIAEMPAHTHTYTSPSVPEPKRRTAGGACVTSIVNGTATGSTGSGTAHGHGATYRPGARVGILCSKD